MLRFYQEGDNALDNDNNSVLNESLKILIPVAALVLCLAIGLISFKMLKKSEKGTDVSGREIAMSESETESKQPYSEEKQSDSTELQDKPASEQVNDSEDENEPIEATEEKEAVETERKESAEIPAISMSTIESVFASSWKAEPEYDLYHVPENIIDGDMNTGWCEDAEGNGEGEEVVLYFDKNYMVSGMYIYPGYHKNESLFVKNGMPIRIKITGDHSETFDLDDEMNRQKLTFETPMITDELTIEILKVRKGTKYSDTLITDVKLF